MKRLYVYAAEMLLIFCAFAFLFTAQADDSLQVQVNGYVAVCNSYYETISRPISKGTVSLQKNEFLSYVIEVKNTSGMDSEYTAPYYRIDNGEKLVWAYLPIKAGETAQCHIYEINMKKLKPGNHLVEFYIRDHLVYSAYLYLPQNGENVSDTMLLQKRNSPLWLSRMRYPAQDEIDKMKGKERSPYIVYYPQFPNSEGITEYMLDFQIDDMDDGTYFSTMNAGMELSSLRDRYVSVTNDFYYAGSFYCGFQRWENGKTGVIMSVWDCFCTDSDGNTTIICANELYPERKTGVSKPGGEGSFQQFIIPYPWYARHPYRMLMQQSRSDETGNTVLTMWMCDLENGKWTKLVSWDLGYVSRYISANSVAGFMENYNVQHNGSIRNVSISNICGRDVQTGKWKTVDTVVFTVNNSMGNIAYTGSYNFGADNNSFWIITSGVNGLCDLPKSGSTYTVQKVMDVENIYTPPVSNGIKTRISDINEDGEKDGRDVVRLMKYLAGDEDEEMGVPIEIDLEAADINCDGNVDELDLLILMRFLAENWEDLDQDGKLTSNDLVTYWLQFQE